MSNLKYRLLAIAAMIVLAVWQLFPRTVVERVRRGDRYVYDTTTRVPLKRGLDLQGGMHLSLEIDESKQAVTDKSEALDRALKVVRTRIDEFGVSEPIVQKSGNDRIIVELPGIDDEERAIDVVQKSAFLQFQITDETRALERVLPRLDAIIRESGVAGSAPAGGDTATRPGQKGLQELFTPGGDSAAKAGGDSAATDTAASLTTGGPFSKLIAGGGDMPGEYFVAETDVMTEQHYLDMPAVRAALPPGKTLRWGGDPVSRGGTMFRPLYVVDTRPIITGEYLTDAKPNQVPIEGTVVEFTLNNEGGRRFRAETGKHVGDYMAIVLDDRVMGRPPVIQSAIGTRGQITMGQGRSLQEAQDLALVLRAGALPVPLKVAEVRKIGASLGEDAIRQGLLAGALGLALVILIMVVYYRFSGFLAVVGLMFYGLTTLGILAGFDATLTLPGLAGFVLSIGMAVDANFLIFERIREEMVRGKTIRTAINEGFDHAWSAIVDTHVTTALTAAILYQFGTGPVRGFAVALLAGLAASMVSAIFVVRTLFLVWLHRTRASQPLSI
ncbi:MAG: SecD export rane protein [Geminicoccaceae bacterium]|nr:SecD export rane protein [Geminicoccaceae bacterium]